MKKLLISLIIGMSITLCACNTKLTEAEIRDKDSKILKDYKKLYNLDLKAYNNRKTQDELITYWEREAKNHPKEDISTVFLRTQLNYIEFDQPGIKDAFKSMFSLNADGKNNFKECDKSEYKDAKKIPFKDLENLSQLNKEALTLRESDEKLKEFDFKFKNAEEELLLTLMKGHKEGEGMSSEEFLKLDYKNKWHEIWKNQEQELKAMKKKIDNMK